MSTPFDIWDQAVLTDLVTRPTTLEFEDNPALGSVIAPLRPIEARSAKLITRQSKAFGLGQFKTPDATPALYSPEVTFNETLIELALLEEMHRISGETWLQLHSSDENIRRAAGNDLVERGKVIQLRNERLTEWMRWQAFSGSLTIEYPTGSQIPIDYGLPSGHKPTVSTAWSTTASADPISDMRSWANQIATSSGHYGLRFHMSSTTWDYIIRNTSVRNLLTATNRAMLIPTKEDVLSLLRDGSDIVIYDNGYRPESAGTSRGVPDNLTRFIPHGKVLVTTSYVVEGRNIADTLDGQVLINGGYNQVQIAQGTQAEVIVDPMSKNHYFRVASARIPRLIFPECFLWATVV